MRLHSRVALVSLVGGWALVFAGAAHAQLALQGNDASHATDGDSRVDACDRESDGYGVHADGVNLAGDRFRVDDQNGSKKGCNETAFMGFNAVYRHRAVEERPKWYEPDIKGDWAYDY